MISLCTGSEKQAAFFIEELGKAFPDNDFSMCARRGGDKQLWWHVEVDDSDFCLEDADMKMFTEAMWAGYRICEKIENDDRLPLTTV